MEEKKIYDEYTEEEYEEAVKNGLSLGEEQQLFNEYWNDWDNDDYDYFSEWDIEQCKKEICNLKEENKKIKDLCNKYEEEHKTVFEEWKKDIKAIDEFRDWLNKESDDCRFYGEHEKGDILDIVIYEIDKLKGVIKE